jgi:amidophosphoribosyltransferase
MDAGGVSFSLYYALYALQHRGQESAGIVSSDGEVLVSHRGMGHVAEIFDQGILARLRGGLAIGHNRYSTTGSSRRFNAQPMLVPGPSGEIALAHNGNIVNADYLRKELEGRGFAFSTTTDSEVIAHLIASAPRESMVDKIKYAMSRLSGAYSLVILTRDKLFGVRDPMGVRPLCLGSLDGHGWTIASETCALDHIGADFIREVEPGEIIFISGKGVQSFTESSARRALCIFEYIYFARPDSVINGRLLYPARQAMGARLAQEHPVDADLVMGVPVAARQKFEFGEMGADYHLVNMERGTDAIRRQVSQSGLRPAGTIGDYRVANPEKK